MPYAHANGLRLYYEEMGSGPPLVLLNNLTGTLDETGLGAWAGLGGWGTLRPYLAQRYHVIHVDSRGHGRTNNPEGPDAFALATLAADIVALIDRLELGPAHVAGFSLGGIMGLELALARATLVRSVIGIGTNYTTNEKSRTAYLGLDPDRVEREDPAWAADLARRHD